MELIERPDSRVVTYLNSLSFEDFKSSCMEDAEDNGESKPKLKDIKVKYKLLKQFCKTNIKTKGVTKRIYSYSQTTPVGLGGRLFSGGSIQGIRRIYRGALLNGITTDIDMKNAHPVLLRYVCKKHNIPCPQLEYYINNREDCLSEFNSREKGKKLYLVATNNDKIIHDKELPSQFKAYDREMKSIQKKLVGLEDYKELRESIPDFKHTENYNGSVINRILCYYENIILQHAIHYVNTKGMEIAVPMFDGFELYGDHYDNPDLISQIETYVDSQVPGMKMSWAYKQHDTSLKIPEDFVESEVVNNFQEVKEDFERNHCKIVNKSMFLYHTLEEIIPKTRNQMIVSYEDLTYRNSNEDQQFIDKWFISPSILKYDDIGIYPNSKLCPTNHFNVWIPFAMEKYTEPYKKNEEALSCFLGHIKILCNNEEVIYDYFVKWIAQMVQYPEVKTIIPTLISEEGAGKGTLIKLLRKLLGAKKVFETTNPGRDVWGQFNGIMANAFLVNLDELSKKDLLESEGKFKALVTNDTITINNKGVPSYEITSYHRFIATTNNKEPINTKHGDRRNLIIYSSNERKGDAEYFRKVNEFMEDITALRTFYDYLKTIPDMDKFGNIPIPQTEYQQELKQLSRDPIDLWLEDYTREKWGHFESTQLTGYEILRSFEFWKDRNFIKYDISALKLGVRLTNMKIPGISKGGHTRKGETKIFNLQQLAEFYKIDTYTD